MSPAEQHRFVHEQLTAFKATLSLEMHGMPVDVERMLTCIHEHLFDPALTVGAVLERCGIRSNSYSHRFKAVLVDAGEPPLTVRRYIEKRRMEAAKRLLRHPELELTLIALSLGFEHYSRFVRTCHRWLGCSPSAYRRKCQDEMQG